MVAGIASEERCVNAGNQWLSAEKACLKIKFLTCTNVLMKTSVVQRLTLNAGECWSTFV